MGSCAAPSAKGDDKFITTDYLQQCPKSYGLGGYTSIFFDNGFYTDFIAKYIHSTNVYSYLSPSEPPRVSWRVFYL